MSNISLFLKSNKKPKENTFYPATESLCDEDGKPLEWEIRPVSTKEHNAIQSDSMKEVPLPGKQGKRGKTESKLDQVEYLRKLVAASVVYPDLLSAELQDSYGVKKPEELVQEMVSEAGEWNRFAEFISDFNGFAPLDEKVDAAKNSSKTETPKQSFSI